LDARGIDAKFPHILCVMLRGAAVKEQIPQSPIEWRHCRARMTTGIDEMQSWNTDYLL
jgi:hypothetical protein